MVKVMVKVRVRFVARVGLFLSLSLNPKGMGNCWANDIVLGIRDRELGISK